jgi:hypothetical protein
VRAGLRADSPPTGEARETLENHLSTSFWKYTQNGLLGGNKPDRSQRVLLGLAVLDLEAVLEALKKSAVARYARYR